MLTQEQLIAIARDLADEIAVRSAQDFSKIHFITQDEGTSLEQVVAENAQLKILEAFSGFAAK